MAHEFNEPQKKELKRIWLGCGGQEEQAENFIGELAYFFDNCPELISGSHKKIESQHSRDYSSVAQQCERLVKALEKIPDPDMLNILSIREKRPEYGGRNVPICDPLDYVKGIQELAEFQSDQLKKCNKYERQLSSLWKFITKEKRFRPLEKISRSHLLDLAVALWPEVDSASFEKAYRPEEEIR